MVFVGIKNYCKRSMIKNIFYNDRSHFRKRKSCSISKVCLDSPKDNLHWLLRCKTLSTIKYINYPKNTPCCGGTLLQLSSDWEEFLGKAFPGWVGIHLLLFVQGWDSVEEILPLDLYPLLDHKSQGE